MQFEHAAVHKEMTKDRERAEKLEHKLGVITHGYVSREKKLKEDIQVAWTTLEASCSPWQNAFLESCAFLGIKKD